jgi:hypothetical protein
MSITVVLLPFVTYLLTLPRNPVVGFQVLAAVTIKITEFWDVMPRGLVDIYWRSGQEGNKNKNRKRIGTDSHLKKGQYTRGLTNWIKNLFYPEDGGGTSLRNVGNDRRDYMASQS